MAFPSASIAACSASDTSLLRETLRLQSRSLSGSPCLSSLRPKKAPGRPRAFC